MRTGRAFENTMISLGYIMDIFTRILVSMQIHTHLGARAAVRMSKPNIALCPPLQDSSSKADATAYITFTSTWNSRSVKKPNILYWTIEASKTSWKQYFTCQTEACLPPKKNLAPNVLMSWSHGIHPCLWPNTYNRCSPFPTTTCHRVKRFLIVKRCVPC